MMIAVSQLVAEIQARALAQSAQLNEKEDREAADQMCKLISAVCRQAIPQISVALKGLDFPRGFSSVHYVHAETGENMGGISNFEGRPITPLEVAICAQCCAYAYDGEVEKIAVLPTRNHGILELSITVTSESSPSR